MAGLGVKLTRSFRVNKGDGKMAIFVNSNTTHAPVNASSRTVYLTKPSNVLPNDLMLILVTTDTDSGSNISKLKGLSNVSGGLSKIAEFCYSGGQPVSDLSSATHNVMYLASRTVLSSDPSSYGIIIGENSSFTTIVTAIFLRGVKFDKYGSLSYASANLSPPTIYASSNPALSLIVSVPHSTITTISKRPAGYNIITETSIASYGNQYAYWLESANGTIMPVNVTSPDAFNGIAGQFIFKTIINPPSKPSLVTVIKDKAKVGESIWVGWSKVELPTQPNGTVLDAQHVYYEVSVFDGTKWTPHTYSTAVTTDLKIPAMADTTKAKIRVRAYVLYGGVEYYTNFGDGTEYVESKEFTVYNNTPPNAPTRLKVSVTGGQTVKPLDKVNIESVLGTDIDVGDVLTGSIDYWNGEDWVQIAQGLKPVSGKVTFNHLIPAKSVTLAKYRVATFDGKDYGPHVESVSFNVSAPDPNRKLPNAFTFDGIDDYIQFPSLPNYNLGTTGTWEIMFSSKQVVPAGNNSVVVFGKEGSWYFEYRVNGTMDFFLVTPNGIRGINSVVNVNDGVFRMLTVTYDGANLRFYIDGVLKSTVVQSGDIVDTTNPITFGKPLRSSEFLNIWYEGKLGIPRVWNRVLTPTEIDNNKRKVLVGNESGLIFNCIFHANTGECFDSKNNAFGMLFNGIAWAYTFTPLEGLALPLPASIRDKANVDYLRVQTNLFRKNNGLAEITSWTDSTIVKGSTPVRAVHLNEIEDGLEEVYNQAGEVILDQAVKKVIGETVLPRDTRFLVRDINVRFEAIVKALMNKS